MSERFKLVQRAIDRTNPLRLGRPSVLAALKASVSAHGEVWWKVTHWPESTRIELRGLEGWGIGVELRTC